MGPGEVTGREGTAEDQEIRPTAEMESPRAEGECDPNGAGGPPTSAAAVTLMALNDTKAGMAGLDKAKIDEIILSASRGSPFYLAQQRRQARLSQQLDQLCRSRARLSADALSRAERAWAPSLRTWERQERRLDRTLVHVDMDAFYAAVEMRDDPSLRHVPMAVGGNDMLSTSNYPARRFGVRAGMPGFIGKKLCPHLKLVPPNFDKYTQVSQDIRSVFREYDPNFCPMSLDEAYLDLTDHLAALPEDQRDVERVVGELRRKIQVKTSLTASAGIAPNTLLAKVCSDLNKPNGQFYLKPDRDTVMEFVKSLAIRKISGIGSVSEQRLKALGVNTCQDLFEQRGVIRLLFSEHSANFLLRIALGLGPTRLSDWSERERKSMSTETTFRDTDNPQELKEICSKLCADLASDLEKAKLHGRAITMKLKTADFQTKTRVSNLLDYTSDFSVIEQTAQKLLRSFTESASSASASAVTDKTTLKFRLLGVRMSDLADHLHLSSAGGRRQTTMHGFLQQSPSPSPAVAENCGEIGAGKSFQCPICMKNVRARGEHAFNAHLDLCLSRPGGESGEGGDDNGAADESSDKTVPRGAVAAVNADADADHEIGRLPKTGNSPRAADSVAEAVLVAKGEQNREGEGKIREDSAGDDHDDEDDVICPICERTIKKSENEINAHIDECLNRDLLSFAAASSGDRQERNSSSSSSKGSSKRKATKPSFGKNKKIRDIKSYFGVNNQ